MSHLQIANCLCHKVAESNTWEYKNENIWLGDTIIIINWKNKTAKELLPAETWQNAMHIQRNNNKKTQENNTLLFICIISNE